MLHAMTLEKEVVGAVVRWHSVAKASLSPAGSGLCSRACASADTHVNCPLVFQQVLSLGTLTPLSGGQ